MKCLEPKIFSNGMIKKVKNQYLNTYTFEYSNCTKEQVVKEILKLEKVFNCVLYLGSKWVINCGVSTVYTVECYNMKEKYKKVLDKEIYS